LTLRRRSFRPGEWVRGCIENLGTTGFRLPEFATLERRERGRWTPASYAGESTPPESDAGHILDGGATGTILSFVSSEAPPGIYRMVFVVVTVHKGILSNLTIAAAPFKVTRGPR
jgi:hypothetical protein